MPGKLKLNLLLNRAGLCCGTAMLFNTVAMSHDGKGTPLAAKASIPVNYHQWVMVGIAVSYAVYLIIRWKKKAGKKQDDIKN
jgi:hypothetical protein